jgi:hypothetical protein
LTILDEGLAIVQNKDSGFRFFPEQVKEFSVVPSSPIAVNYALG